MTNQATAGTPTCDCKLWDILVESAKERTTIRYSKLARQAGLEQCQDELRTLLQRIRMYCTENNLPALKARSFSEALIACQSRYNLEYCNNVTNAAGRRVRGFLGIEVLVRNHISVFSGDSMRTYVPEDVPEEWRR